MAKKRKEITEEEDFDFKIPKFDEEKFITKERRNIKTLFISFLLGLLIAIISFGFWVLLSGNVVRWVLVLLIGVFNASWLRYIFLRLHIDLTDFGKKGWAGTFATYFFTWLSILIVLCNPPFYDDEAPHVLAAALPGAQEPGGTVLIVAQITDNTGIIKQGINFSLTDPNGLVSYPDFIFNNTIFRYTYENTENLLGEYTVSLLVTDVNGRVNNDYKNLTFTYTNDTLAITSSRFSDIRSGDSIIISADEDISPLNFRVYYKVDNGSDINVDRKELNDKSKYETNAEFKGWEENSNSTITVYAETLVYFINIPEEFNNTVKDTTTYQFTTGADPVIGTGPTLVEYNYTLAALNQDQLPNTLNYALPYPVGVGYIPGFEMILFVLAVVLMVVVIRRKKKKAEP